jgi:hypothetical protein
MPFPDRESDADAGAAAAPGPGSDDGPAPRRAPGLAPDAAPGPEAESDAESGSDAEAGSGSRPLIRDLSTLRRRAAADAVARFLDDLGRIAGDVPHRLVEGSAVAAQVRFTDEQLIRAVLRVDVGVSPAARPRYEARLRDHGFIPGSGSGDVALMRIAGRRGRRPVHVLFEGPDAPPPSPHPPGSPEAAAERARRLSAAFRPILGTWLTTVEREGDDETRLTETREVHLVSDQPAAPPSPRD